MEDGEHFVRAESKLHDMVLGSESRHKVNEEIQISE